MTDSTHDTAAELIAAARADAATEHPLTASDAHPALSLLPDAPTQDQILAFGLRLQSLEDEHGVVDVGTMHHHADRLYGRSMVVKAGCFIVGLPHKVSGLSFSVGDITVWTDHGRQRYAGAHVLTTEIGKMRIGFAHADTTLFTTHANSTGSTDVAVIEDSLVEHAELLQSRRAPTVAAIDTRRAPAVLTTEGTK